MNNLRENNIISHYGNKYHNKKNNIAKEIG